MKNFNKNIFIVSTGLIALLLIPSFLAAWAEDEGTLGDDSFWIYFANIFYVLRFPFHTLLWFIFSYSAILFLIGLGLNCMFYGFIIERLFAFFRKKKAPMGLWDRR
ncbi:MAG: hypothetical protein NT150_11875 [Bacteroidetes bacterium]|nr:hypothetical protein [Bacteroidota bacterium]